LLLLQLLLQHCCGTVSRKFISEWLAVHSCCAGDCMEIELGLLYWWFFLFGFCNAAAALLQLPVGAARRAAY